jgi:hypothetical protein
MYVFLSFWLCRKEEANDVFSQSFTQALYHLAAAPEYVAPLREELEAALLDVGWSKAAMGKCVKLDSFLRESQRFTGSSAGQSFSIIRLSIHLFIIVFIQST